MPVPGRFRRRLSAGAGRGLSRPRSFRPDLLQSGAIVGGGGAANRAGHGLVHGGRRLCPGDGRRIDHRQGRGDDLSRRPAPGARGHRRDRQRRGIGRGRIAQPGVRRHRPLRPRRPSRARDRARDRRQSQPAEDYRDRAAGASGAALSGRRSLWDHPARHPPPLRRARDHRPDRRRQRIRRIQAALRPDPDLRLCPYLGLSGRHPRQQRHPLFRKRAEGRAFHRIVRAAPDPAGLSAKHHRLYGRPQIRGGRHRQGRGQDGDRGRDRSGAEIHRDHRRQLWRRQLRHVRAGLFAALFVDVAECEDLGHGRRAGRLGHGATAPRRPRGARRQLGARRRGRVQGADPRPVRDPGSSLLCQRPAVG